MKAPDFSKFPVLETDRLMLRKLSIDDVNEIFQLRSDIEVAALVGKAPFTSLTEAVAYIHKIENLINENECVFWGITDKDSPAMIGAVCLWNFDIVNETVEIGYELLPRFQNKGIMAEVIANILKYGLEVMGAKSILAFPSAENPRSINLLEKMGFKLAPSTHKNSHESVPGMLTFSFT